MFISAGNVFLTSKAYSSLKMGLTANNEWASILSLVQNFDLVNWPYLTKVICEIYF